MKNNNTYMGLGAKETEFVARLTYEKKTIISVNEIDDFLPKGYKYRNQFLYNLKQKKILTPIKRGFYVFTPIESVKSGIRINELLIPSVFFPRKNYYIGYSTMFNYYGFTDQLFQTVYVINTSLSKERSVSGVSYKFIKVPQNRMYGIETINIQGSDVPVSSRERTLVDMVYFNNPVGGINSAIGILKKEIEKGSCNVKKLIELASVFPVVMVRKHIGVVLEDLGIGNSALRVLIKSVEKTSISSLTGSRRGTLNKTWRVIVNAAQK
jgi:predicted transcriptional regulator of viral defense system